MHAWRRAATLRGALAPISTATACCFALVNCLEIVGEAAARVSEETRQRIPSVPWKAVISMRNRLIHASFDINRDTVWMTVSSELVPLEEAIKEALASDTPSGDQVTP